VIDAPTILLAAACLAGSVVYVLARVRLNNGLAAAVKVFSSTAFIALALVNGAAGSVYGRLILLALALSWAGDVLLLSLKRSYLLSGIAAFLLAHLAFAGAFVSKPLVPYPSLIAAGIVLILAAIVGRWLWKYLDGFYKIAVPIYLAAIGLMIVLAVGASSTELPVTVAVGAAAFAVSDVSVARDRFVERSIVNKAWGIPLYYFAQVLLAISVAYG
jgi:uncharacterized membrane protein YhhN